MDELLIALVESDRRRHHAISEGIVGFIEDFMTGKPLPYLKEAEKYGLWDAEEKVTLKSDVKKLTGKEVYKLSTSTFLPAVLKMSRFVLYGYEKFLRDEDVPLFIAGDEKEKYSDFMKLLSVDDKSDELKMWLRFYFRIKNKITNDEDEPEELGKASYIG